MMMQQQQPEEPSWMMKFEDILKDTTFSYLYGFCDAKESFQTLEVIEQDIIDPQQLGSLRRINDKRFVRSTRVIKMTGICRINPIPVVSLPSTPHELPIPPTARVYRDRYMNAVKIHLIHGTNLFALFRGMVKIERPNMAVCLRYLTDFTPNGYWGATAEGQSNRSPQPQYEIGFEYYEKVFENEKREWFETHFRPFIKEIVRERLVCDSCVYFH